VYEIGRREELHTIYILVAFNTLCFSKWCCWIYTNQRRHLKNGGVPHYLIPTASRSVLRASTLAQTKVSGDVGVSRWGSLGLQRWRTADECGWWAYDEAVARTNPGYEKKVSGQGMRIWDGVTHLAAVRESWGCLEVEKTPHCVGFSNLMVECFSVGHPRNVWIMPSRRAQYRLRLFAPPCILSEPI
jgi:hypothetical protein